MRVATVLATLLTAASPKKKFQDTMPGCSPKGKEGKDGCSNNPVTLVYHREKVPQVPQEILQSAAGYGLLKKMFNGARNTQIKAAKTKELSAAWKKRPAY